MAAVVDVDKLPLSVALRRSANLATGRNWALTGGDDYELCFTVAADKVAQCQRLIKEGELTATPIGQIIDGQGVRFVDGQGAAFKISGSGYKHF